MSTLHNVSEFVFHNRKPSKAQINACIKNAMKDGSKAISISWGENCIELDYHEGNKAWYGSGWIKTIGGNALAQELNRTQKTATTKFMEEHFQLIRIGF
jgi:hypothetical protein